MLPSTAQAFNHPGGLHTQADLDRMRTNVLAGNHPWVDDWNVLITDSEAQSSYLPSPYADMGANRQQADADAHAAYLNAIRWYISGDVTYANAATNILNKWSATVNQVPSNTGLVGLPIMSFALAGEMLRTYGGWQAADFSTYTNMMLTYLYPACTNWVWSQPCTFAHWTSWDAPNNAAILTIGVLCDNTNLFNDAVSRYEGSISTAAVSNAIPYLFGPIGEPEESGRDQEHCTLGIADMGVACQVAWNQGVDLYGYANNRLLAGIEYLAQYNLSHDVTYTAFNDCANDNLFFVSDNGRGRIDDRPVYEMFYNHYVVQQGLSAPGITAMARLYRPERGSSDHFGYGTLTYTRNGAASPYLPTPCPPAPTALTATPGITQITLNWTPPPGDLAQGYKVLRATTSGGPYATIASWNANILPTYTDTGVTIGTTYYYVVMAVNQSGVSTMSPETSTTVTSASVPSGWTQQDVGVVTNPGTAQYTAAGGNTFYITGAGTGIAGTYDGGFNYVYQLATNDFTMVARLTSFNANETGLMMRGSLSTNSAEVQFFMADNGRESVFAVRGSNGGNLNHYTTGDLFTTPPAWYKLVRSGNNFTAYQSGDGINWITVQTVTVSAIPTAGYYVGLVMDSGTATFDNVVFTNSAATGTFAPPAAPVNLAGTALAGNVISLSWNAVSGATGYSLKRAIASGGPYTNILTDTPLIAAYDQSASANTTYYYLVTANNGGGESANSSIVTVTTPATSVPAAPATLAATPNGALVALNWSASVGASSYNVKRSITSGGPYTNIATGIIANFTDTNVTAGQRYFYVVTAVDSAGESANSPEASALVLATMQSYFKFDETGGTVAFDSTGNNWNGTLVNGATFAAGYSNNAVNLSSSSSQYVTLPAGVIAALTNFTIAAWVKPTTLSDWMRIFDFGTGTTAYMFLSPQNGSTHTVRFAITTGSGSGEQQINSSSTLPLNTWTHVAVTLNGNVGVLYVNGAAVGTNSSMTLSPSSLGSTMLNYIGKSQYSDPYFNGLVDEFKIYNGALSASDVATLVTSLSAPANLTATAGNGSVSLNWTAVASATTYNVFRSLTSGGPYTLLMSATATNATDTTVTNGTTYYYVVAAVNAAGSSPNSAQSSATPQVPAPAAPTGLSATGGNAQVTLAWNTSSGATSYNVKRANVSGGPYTTITNVATAAYTDTGLANGTTYYYVVSALNAGGESANSTEASATPQVSPPAAPTGLTAIPGNLQATLSWTASSGATSYNVKRSTISGTGYVTITNVTGTSVIDAGLVNGTTYYYVVSALNAGGESANSAQASVTPTDLFGWWKFDEGSGSTAYDSGGGGNNGTLHSGATWISGVISNAVHCDGTTNGYTSFPSALVSTLNDFSVSTWVKVDTNAAWSRVFDFGSGTGTYMFLTPDSGGNTVRYAITTGSSGGEQQLNSATILSTGIWHHIAVTLSGSTGVLYIDGTAVATNSSMTLKPSSLGSTTQNYLGRSQWPADPYLNGGVDDFRIYARALSASEVSTLAGAALPSPWATADIGAVNVTGAATAINGVFAVQGAGTNINGAADACRFVYQASSGDCSNTVRVTGIQTVGANAKAGVMIRETLSAGAMEAGIWVTPTNGIIFTSRNSTGGSTSTSTATGLSAPYWVRIRRVGNSFYSYYSANGTTWTKLGSTKTINMASSAYIGMAVESGISNVLDTATMDNNTIVP